MFRRIISQLPLVMFALAWLMIAFLLGYFTTVKQVFPFQQIDGVFKTKDVIIEHLTGKYASDFLGYSDVPVARFAAARQQPLAPTGNEALLFTGGPQRFLEICPETGCLAVIKDRQGRLVHAYPFRPAQFRAGSLADLPYQQPFMNPERDLNVSGIILLPDGDLPNGDLIVTFYNDKAFPFGAGVARVDRAGNARWYRRDYTHHWPALLPTGEIAVASAEISTKPIWRHLGAGHMLVTGCKDGYLRDTVQLLDAEGKLLKRYAVFDALLASQFRNLLIQTNAPFRKFADTCDPLHLNFVRAVGPELAAVLPGVTPDDLLLSLRNISAVGILDRQSGRMTHVFRGSFFFQHSVQPFGTKLLIFDDLGASATHHASRVLLHDPVTGTETVVLPGAETPPGTEIYTTIAGNIDLSPDGKRALVAVTEAGLGYEIDIATGRLLTRMDNLHDLRSLGLDTAGAEKAARFKQFGIYYAPSPGTRP